MPPEFEINIDEIASSVARTSARNSSNGRDGERDQFNFRQNYDQLSEYDQL